MGNNHVGIWGSVVKTEVAKGVNLACLNDNKEALAGEESEREG